MLESRGKLGAVRPNFGEKRGDHVEIDCFAWRGTLIASEAVQEIGLPERDFFLYGADVDYAIRVREAGYRMYAVFAGRLREEKVSPRQRKRFLGITWEYYSDDFRLYYSFRNEMAVYVKHGLYGSVFKLVLHAAKGVIFFLLRFQPTKALHIARGLSDGVRGRLGKRCQYKAG
jgi:GT2 family glycosyltransferase